MSAWQVDIWVSTSDFQESVHAQTCRECVLLEMLESNIDLSACTLTSNRRSKYE